MQKYDWTYIIETLIQAKADLKIRFTDTIIFDILDSFKPLIWVYTNKRGFLDHRSLRGLSLDDIIDSFDKIMRINARHPHLDWLEYGKAVIIKRDGIRGMIDINQLNALEENIFEIQALQLYIFDSINFDKYIYTYEIRSDNKTQNDRIFRKTPSNNNEEDVLECWDEVIKSNIKSESVLIFKTFETLSKMRIVTITMIFNIEIDNKRPWFCGAENCMIQKLSKKQRISEFNFNLTTNFGSKSSKGHSLTGLRINNKKRCLLSQSMIFRRKYLNESLSIKSNLDKSYIRITPILRMPDISLVVSTSKLKRIPLKSRTRNPSRLNQLRNSSGNNFSDNLPNLEIFTIPFKRKMTMHNTQCKLYIHSDQQKFEPSIEHYSQFCKGDFCNLVYIQLPSHDKSIRFLVPKQAIILGKMQKYSPIKNHEFRHIPNNIILDISKFKSAEKILSKSIITTSLSSSIEFKKVETSSAFESPVCLRCFVVYYNIMSSFQIID